MANLTRDLAIEQGRAALAKRWKFWSDEETLRERLTRLAKNAVSSGPSWPSPRVVSEIVVDTVVPELYALIRQELEEEREHLQ